MPVTADVIVGIGHAAGGGPHARSILARLPAGNGMAAVLVRHPDPAESVQATAADLAAISSTPVVIATDGMPVRPDCVYVVPASHLLSLADGRFVLRELVQCEGMRMPIDHFLCSLATQHGPGCCGVLLSGEGSDGTLGLSEIKAAGGRTIVLDPAEAAAPEMPRNAVSAGVVDAVLPVAQIAGGLLAFAGEIHDRRSTEDDQAALRSIIALLRSRTGHDFRSYKPNTLLRRARRRMGLAKADTLWGYFRHLQLHAEEVRQLRRDLLIGVTDFFRQAEAWRWLEERVLPRLVAEADPKGGVRAWVPACATGKEAYSLAMLLAEAVEASGRGVPFQVFATDADETAVEVARTGVYAAAELRSVPPARLERFFVRRGGGYQVSKRIRETIVFAQQNITSDPPFARLDLVSCRNLLIYLDAQAQKQAIATFHFALRDGGCLFLGIAESVAENEHLFASLSKKWRIFRRLPAGPTARLAPAPFPMGGETAGAGRAVRGAGRRDSLALIAQQMLLERFAPAAAIADRRRRLLFNLGPVDRYLTVAPGEVSLDVVEMAREGLRTALRGAFRAAVGEDRVVNVAARVLRDGAAVPVRMTVTPLRAEKGAEALLLVTFEEREPAAPAGAEVAACDAGTRQLEEELGLMRDELQSAVDQLEASNEELKASNEEAMASNEELQSANEELETSKEELESLNDELSTVNLRLQEKNDELESANNDLANFLAGTGVATVFLDRCLSIRRFTPQVASLLSLIDSDVGRPLADIVRKVPDEALVSEAALVLQDLQPRAAELRSGDGRWYARRILPYRTRDERIEGVVVTYVEVTDIKSAEAEATRLASFPERNPNPVVEADADGRVSYQNPAARALFPDLGERGLAHPWLAGLPSAAEALLGAGVKQVVREVSVGAAAYEQATFLDGHSGRLRMYGRDVTERRRAEEALRRSNADLERRIQERTAELRKANETLELRVAERTERLERAQAIAHLGSWELDLVDNVLTWSDEVYRIFGLEPQEFGATYHAFLEAVHPADRAAVDAAYRDSVREGRDTYEIEHRVVRRGTGEIRVVHERCAHFRDAAGRIVRSIGMVHDVTERNLAEETLQRSLRRFELLARTAGELLEAPAPQELVESLCRKVMEHIDCQACVNFLVDEASNRLHLNAHAGISAEDARRIEWLDFGAGVCGCAARDGRRIVAEHIPGTPDPRTELVRSLGIKAYCCNPLLGPGGKVIGTLSFGACARETFSDDDLSLMQAVTDLVAVAMSRMQATQALRLTAEELARSNRDLAQFAYVASHDLQEPLRMVSSFVSLLQARYGDRLDEKGAEFIDRALEGTVRMRRLIDDLLEYGRVDRRESAGAPVAVRDALDDALANLAAGIGESGADVCAGELPTLVGDRARLAAVLQNLIANAITYRRPGIAPRVRVGARRRGEDWVFSVTDNGIGIPPEQFHRIFLIFQRLHNRDAYPGTGLGLAIVKKIVEADGGRVWVESRVGEGSSFHFSLPAASQGCPPSA